MKKVLTTLVVLLVACSSSAPSFSVSKQWARTSPMDAANGAAYATIACPSDDALVGAAVDATAAQKVELHETVMGGPTGDTAMAQDQGIWPKLDPYLAHGISHGGAAEQFQPHGACPVIISCPTP